MRYAQDFRETTLQGSHLHFTNVVRRCSRGNVNRCLFTPDRELQINQSLDHTKIQVGELMNFIGVTFRNAAAEFFTEAEVTQRS